MASQHDASEQPERDLIRRKVARLCRRWRLPKSEIAVIEHDLGVHLRLQRDEYDAAQASLATFIDRISTHWLNSYLRHRFAAKRDPRREECSLDELVRDAAGKAAARHELLEEASTDSQLIHDLRRDLATLRDLLPSDAHRRYLDAKARGGTTNSIAIELGVCRPRVEVIELEVREVAITIGLGEYLSR